VGRLAAEAAEAAEGAIVVVVVLPLLELVLQDPGVVVDDGPV
jgi:hypothetical protein